MASVAVWLWTDAQGAQHKCPLDEPPPCQAVATEQDVDAWREEILSELDRLDIKSIRALREGNTQRLTEIEARASDLRRWLKGLANAGNAV